MLNKIMSVKFLIVPKKESLTHQYSCEIINIIFQKEPVICPCKAVKSSSKSLSPSLLTNCDHVLTISLFLLISSSQYLSQVQQLHCPKISKVYYNLLTLFKCQGMFIKAERGSSYMRNIFHLSSSQSIADICLSVHIDETNMLFHHHKREILPE